MKTKIHNSKHNNNSTIEKKHKIIFGIYALMLILNLIAFTIKMFNLFEFLTILLLCLISLIVSIPCKN